MDTQAPPAADKQEGSTTPGPNVGPTVSPSLLMAVFGRLKDYGGSVFKQRKPWGELVDRNAFARPESVTEATTRLRKNFAYFKINYLIVIVLTLMVCMLMNPGSLLVLFTLLAAWLYIFVIRTTPLSIGNHTISDRGKLIGMTGLSFVVIFFLTSVGTVLFSALSIGFVVIALHGATRVPDDLFLDETEENQSFLSILTGGKQTTAIASNV